MGELTLVIAALSFLLLRQFQWSRKSINEQTDRNTYLQKEMAEKIIENARLTAQLETCDHRRQEATRAAKTYRSQYLELKVVYDLLVDKE